MPESINELVVVVKRRGMKDYLVDVAVKTNIWIRTELQREQFEVIRKARPKILFLQSDGGRTKEEWEAIRINRKMFDEEIDWNCQVIRIYEDANFGMYAMGEKVRAIVWDHVNSCIFLEDDDIPSVSYFRFCAEMLEKYKDDQRIYAVCGLNCIGVNEKCSADYFFARYASIWGIALWKRSALQHTTAFTEDEYTMQLLEKETREHPSHWKQIQRIARSGEYDGHLPGSEFYMNLAVYGYHQMFIVPKYNLMNNKGSNGNSAHSDSLKKLPKAVRRLFNMTTYELSFPLKEPIYVIPDEYFEEERNRILALDHPLIDAWRKLERGCLLIAHGDWKKFLRKFLKYTNKAYQKEN